jgi:signal transduction histidine kinase
VDRFRWYETLCGWVFGRQVSVSDDVEDWSSEEEASPLGQSGRRAELLHRLKTPLLGIRQLSELLPQTEALSSDGRRKVDIIRQAAIEGMGVVDELLSPQLGRSLRVPTQDIDFGQLVHEVTARLRPTAQLKRQPVRIAAAENCVVRGDVVGLRAVAENLIGNALKYSAPDTAVMVRVARGDGTVRFIVTDEGPGLRPEDQGRLFKPYQHLGTHPTGGEGSSGVGLYLTKRIVEAHGGRIGVVSSPGQGSTFVVVFPAGTSRTGDVEDRRNEEPSES